MARGCAEVNQRAPLALREEARHVGDSDLELERRRHAVERLEPVVLRILAVRVEVDEARRDHEARGVEHGRAPQRLLRNGRDAAARNPDVADRVETGLGVHDPASLKDDLVRRGLPHKTQNDCHHDAA